MDEKKEEPSTSSARLVPLSAGAFLLNLTPAWLRTLHRRGKVELARPGGPTGKWYISEQEIARLADHRRWRAWT